MEDGSCCAEAFQKQECQPDNLVRGEAASERYQDCPQATNLKYNSLIDQTMKRLDALGLDHLKEDKCGKSMWVVATLREWRTRGD